MRREKLATAFFAAAVVLGLAASAGAVDGTIEINQAKVLANGGSFPYFITASGSYRLTGNLQVPSGLAVCGGIQVDASNVTIDLNGFSITGPGAACPYGIHAGVGDLGTTVENGTVTGFTKGIGVNDSSTVKSVHANSNSNNGIEVGQFSVVEGCTANLNASGVGVFCGGPGCLISGNVLNSNGTSGVSIGGGPSLILGNTIISAPVVNTAEPLSLPDATTGYGENVMSGFTDGLGGTMVVGGTSMKNNVCDGHLC